MDALTLWVTLALLVVSITLFFITRRAHRAERIAERQRRQIRWMLENLVVYDPKVPGGAYRHLLDHEFRELTQWLN